MALDLIRRGLCCDSFDILVEFRIYLADVLQRPITFLVWRWVHGGFAFPCSVSASIMARSRPAVRRIKEAVGVNKIRIRLGHESLNVTLAYLKG